MNRQSFITILLAVLMSMIGAKTFAYNIAVPNSDGKTIYYAWANEEKTELAVTYYYSTIDRGSYSYHSNYSGHILIPESVVYEGYTYNVISISEYAFNECSGLTSVTIPNSVTSIDYRAFYGCSGLTSVSIPNSVTSISWCAFQNCSGLTSVTIPNSVTSIGDYAFQNCSGLTSITIPNSVNSIGYGAFQYCSGLTSITFPEKVISVDLEIFTGTAWYENQPEGLVYLGKMAYSYKGIMPENAHINIMDGTIGIANYAFAHYSNLASVTIPNSVTSIGYNAFYECYRLNSVTIPNKVTSIGEGAFYYCVDLTSVIIPNSVTFIGKDAFSNTQWYYNQSDGVVYAGKVAYEYKGKETMSGNTQIYIRRRYIKYF
jgi:hypothetical protein